jgi:hypothetical protein
LVSSTELGTPILTRSLVSLTGGHPVDVRDVRGGSPFAVAGESPSPGEISFPFCLSIYGALSPRYRVCAAFARSACCGCSVPLAMARGEMRDEADQCASRQGDQAETTLCGRSATTSSWHAGQRQLARGIVALTLLVLLKGAACAVPLSSEKLTGLKTPASHLRAKEILGDDNLQVTGPLFSPNAPVGCTTLAHRQRALA